MAGWLVGMTKNGTFRLFASSSKSGALVPVLVNSLDNAGYFSDPELFKKRYLLPNFYAALWFLSA
jgi:hypothetical protein